MTPTFHKPIPMETRVRFSKDFRVDGTDFTCGTVVGVSFKHVFYTYIVLLDEPMSSEEGMVRAVAVPGGLLESEDGSFNWCN